jgi:2'-5' RNA ligase
MKTFKEYLVEMSNPNGNYVCADILSMKGFLFAMEQLGIDLSIGDPPPGNDYHITLMYSKTTSVSTDRILSGLSSNFPTPFRVKFAAAECFDSTPKEGERDEDKSCVVLKINSTALEKAHDYLKSFNLVHSYPEFKPHITILYNIKKEDAYRIRDQINALIANMEFTITGYKSQEINKNYV